MWRIAAIGFVVVGVPLLLGAFFVTESKFLSYLGAGSVLFLWLVALVKAMLERPFRIARTSIAVYFFFGLLFLTTVLSYLEQVVSQEQFEYQLRALAACAVWSSVFFVMPLLLRSQAHLLIFAQLLDALGWFITITVFVGAFGYGGEVQGVDTGALRAFGVFGDQVGYVLAFFAARSALKGRYWAAACHMAALVLTGTQGALVVLLVAVLATLLSGARSMLARPISSNIAAALAIVLLLGLVIISPLGNTVTHRIFDSDSLEATAAGRLGSMALGLQVFISHPLYGVGFFGFRFALWEFFPQQYFSELLDNYLALTTNQFLQTATDGGLTALLGLSIMLYSMLTKLKTAATSSAAALFQSDMKAAWVWTIGMILGNQTAVWILPESIITYVFFMLSGAALACSLLDKGAMMDHRRFQP
jgi:hypothetical protein